MLGINRALATAGWASSVTQAKFKAEGTFGAAVTLNLAYLTPIAPLGNGLNDWLPETGSLVKVAIFSPLLLYNT